MREFLFREACRRAADTREVDGCGESVERGHRLDRIGGAEPRQQRAAAPTPDTSPERTAKFIKDEIAKWAPVIKAAGVRVE